jgi:outer membrane receptor protein involved in Fe transport
MSPRTHLTWLAAWLTLAAPPSAWAQADDEADDAPQEQADDAPADDPLRPPITPGGDPLLDALARDGDEEGDPEGEPYDLGDQKVTGQRRERAESGAAFDIELGQLGALPLSSAADVMMLAPGVLTTNHGGEGHAHETFLRGFYAGEGQDIEYMVDGVPINEVSNPHGHGYADLFFMPADWITSMRLTEGSFDPEQGDFAFAGSVNFVPGVRARGVRARAGYGSFDTRRFMLTWAPEDEADGTFAGVELNETGGFGANRPARRVATMARYEGGRGGAGLRWSTSFAGYMSEYAQPGTLRVDDVEAGRVDFFGTYDPTQGGSSSRALVSARMAHGPNGALLENVAWFGLRTMRLRQNFTGFLVPTETEEEGTVYLGDLQEGRYQATTLGARGSYTLGRRWRERYHELSVGYAGRFDLGRTELVRLRDRLDVPYARDFDREFAIGNVAGWVRAQSEVTDWLLVSGGLRVDSFDFNVRDLNQPDEDTDGARLTEQTIVAGGAAWSPRASATLKLHEDLRWTLAYGRGARSTDAAALSDTEDAPFANSDQVETGLKYRWADEDRALSLQGGYIYALVARDIVFDPGAGRNILIGASDRHAVVFQGRYTERERLDVLLNLGWAQATTEETDETSLDFGQTVLLPYVPQLIARADATYTHDLGVSLGGVPVALRGSANFTFVPGRPLPLGEFGDPFYLLGAAVEADLWHARLRLEGRNLLDLRYRQSEFNYPSRFDRRQPLPSSGPPRAERHFVAGEPRFVMLSVEFDLGELFEERDEDAVGGAGHTHP